MSEAQEADSEDRQAAFTIKEVRELLKIPSVTFEPIQADLLPPNPTQLPRAPKRLVQLLVKGSPTTRWEATKFWSLDFLRSPISFNSSPRNPGTLNSITFEKTTFQARDHFDSSAKVSGTGKQITVEADLAFRSIGYQSTPLPGMSELGIPFDDKLGIIPNDLQGRILSPSRGPGDLTAGHVPGMYCAGWVKRGPTGVIASTMDDAFATAQAIVRDWEGKALFLSNGAGAGNGEAKTGWDGLKMLAEEKGLRRVSWEDWRKIDAVERDRGKMKGKEREKFASVQEMLKVLD